MHAQAEGGAMPANGWTAIPHHVAEDLLARKAAGRTAFAVLYALTRHVDHATGEADPSHAKLARAAGVSVSAARKALDLLEQLGHITRTARTRADGWDASNLYVVVHRAIHRVCASDHPARRAAGRIVRAASGARREAPERNKSTSPSGTIDRRLPPTPKGWPVGLTWDHGAAAVWRRAAAAGHDPAKVLERHDWSRGGIGLAMTLLSQAARTAPAPSRPLVQVATVGTYLTPGAAKRWHEDADGRPVWNPGVR